VAKTVEKAAGGTEENNEQKHWKECGVDSFDSHFSISSSGIHRLFVA
jgi:hypothetical protein